MPPKRTPKQEKELGKELAKMTEDVANERQYEWLMRVLAGEDMHAVATDLGYADSAATVARMKNHPQIGKALTRMRELIALEAGVTAESVIKTYKDILDMNVLDMIDEDTLTAKSFSEIPKWQQRLVQGISVEESFGKDGTRTVKWKFEMMKKDNALNQVARAVGLMDKKIQVEHTMRKEDVAGLLFTNDKENKDMVIDATVVAGLVEDKSDEDE